MPDETLPADAAPVNSTRVIPLTQGYVTVVDAEDFDRLNQYRWKVLKVGDLRYASRNKTRRRGRSTTVLMHREVLGVKDDRKVDHWDGNGLNNQRSNLRVATNTQNAANTSSRGGASCFKGVYWNKAKRKWQAQIANGLNASGKQVVLYLGRFDTEQEAAAAYDRKAIEMHGEFARLNFPREGVNS